MSADITLEASNEEILLYFKIDSEGLDAQTFGNALLAFDELYRSINSIANPGHEIEVDFISSDQGSIRAVFRVFRKDTKNLLRAPVTLLILPILIGILVSKVTSDSVKIVVNDHFYVVEYGNERIILPKEAANILLVDLVAAQELNELIGAYENRSYHITKVYKHSKGPKQPSLF